MEIDQDQPQWLRQFRDLAYNEDYTHFGPYLSWEIVQDGDPFQLKKNNRGMEFARGRVNGEEVIQKSAPRDDIIHEAAVYRKLFHEKEARFVMLAKAVLEEDNHIYIMLPYCSAGDVMDKLRAERSFTPEFIKKVSTQLLSGVDFLHSRNIGHRDLSLENLLLTEQEDIRIMDFDQSRELLTAQGAVQYYDSLCGKANTRAPEVWAAAIARHAGLPGRPRYAAAPVDAYACGAIIFTMLLGAKTAMWSGWEDSRAGLAWAATVLPHCWIELLMQQHGSKALEEQPAAKPLLQGLLHLDPKSRAAPARALKSKWLREAAGEAAAVRLPPQSQPSWMVSLQEQSDLLVDRH